MLAAHRLTQRLVQRPQPQLRQRLLKVVHPRTLQRVAQLIPGLICGRLQLAKLLQHNVLIAPQIDRQPMIVKVPRPSQERKPERRIVVPNDRRVIGSQIHRLA